MHIHDIDDMKYALDYLKRFCIGTRNSKARTVHNMAFYFHSKINDVSEMLEFLKNEEDKKSRGYPIYFDVDYALNILKDQLNKVQQNTDDVDE